MKTAEKKCRFDAFYHRTYRGAMSYLLSRTGDFINCEDLLVKIYAVLFRNFLKETEKNPLADPETMLNEELQTGLNNYWQKHQKDLKMAVVKERRPPYEELLQREFDLLPELAERRLMSEEIAEFISVQAVPMRRAFVLRFYFGKSCEEIAAELKVSKEEVNGYLYYLLEEIRETFLDEFEIGEERAE